MLNFIKKQSNYFRGNSRRKLFSIFVCVICIAVCPVSGFAQQANKHITGTVVDEKGESIIGANVIEKGIANGTSTNLGGQFTLNVSPNAILVISYIGYNSQEVAVGNRT
ncbi:MAG: carboxypeptidase-like regulatory domain-containing protein, partial [Tannerella sp.]|nr:carboxypeptidase-like regulatory domain-containing protein [Tannerella sp.]